MILVLLVRLDQFTFIFAGVDFLHLVANLLLELRISVLSRLLIQWLNIIRREVLILRLGLALLLDEVHLLVQLGLLLFFLLLVRRLLEVSLKLLLQLLGSALGKVEFFIFFFNCRSPGGLLLLMSANSLGHVGSRLLDRLQMLLLFSGVLCLVSRSLRLQFLVHSMAALEIVRFLLAGTRLSLLKRSLGKVAGSSRTIINPVTLLLRLYRFGGILLLDEFLMVIDIVSVSARLRLLLIIQVSLGLLDALALLCLLLISLHLDSLHKTVLLSFHLLPGQLHGFNLAVLLLVQPRLLLCESLLLKLYQGLVERFKRSLPFLILLGRDGLLQELILLGSQTTHLIVRLVNLLHSIVLALHELRDSLSQLLVEIIDLSYLLFSEFLSVLSLDLLLTLSESGRSDVEFVKLVSTIGESVDV